ncbi:Hypothetical predicted protein [Olea europaea subsp. europaea]|uniref:Uncharacterized protein n=1 Tax=Olea europaea subsp. europaea TaxID=158383 RepID=A0A8S0S704_OLEEU|nr:Hypothetical predicted protein [Olea europaea subsp. europaea]
MNPIDFIILNTRNIVWAAQGISTLDRRTRKSLCPCFVSLQNGTHRSIESFLTYVKLSLSEGIDEANAFQLRAGKVFVNCSTAVRAMTELYHSLRITGINYEQNFELLQCSGI